ncbi:MAG: HEAT repeat domain-containing protein, partial [Acidobacteriota bacterium]
MNLDVYQQVLQDYIQKRGDKPGEEGRIARMEAAKAIGFMDPHAPLADKLADFLEDESAEVIRYAIRSAAELKRREDVPLLVNKLQNPLLREDALDALKKIGPKIVGSLADYLHDRNVGPQVRRAVASVLAALGTQEAADFLGWALAGEEGILADEIIDALDRLRTENPSIIFPHDIIKHRVLQEARRHCQGLLRRLEARETGEGAPDPAWEKWQADSVWNIFKLLGLIYGHEDMTKAYQNLETGTKDAVAYALELLDNVLEKDIREVVFPVVEDLPLEEKIRRCRNLLSERIEGKTENE